MECPKCRKEMKCMPYLSTAYPPIDEYVCECGHIEKIVVGHYEIRKVKWFGVLNQENKN